MSAMTCYYSIVHAGSINLKDVMARGWAGIHGALGERFSLYHMHVNYVDV